MIYAPRAIRHFSLANVEARAQRTARAMIPRQAPPVRWRPDPAPTAPKRRVVVRLWLPMTPIFLLLAPFALLLAPLGYFAPPRFRPDPLAAVFAIGQLLLSLSGTVVHVDTREALVSIRIF